jgi:hypothetical protein
MAIENNDLFVLQKSGGGELRKASVAALLADAVTPILPVIPDIPENISDLDDVSDTAPGSGQVLKWDGSEWAPADDEVRNLDNYLQKPGEEGDFIISEAADGTITYSETIDCGTY